MLSIPTVFPRNNLLTLRLCIAAIIAGSMLAQSKTTAADVSEDSIPPALNVLKQAIPNTYLTLTEQEKAEARLQFFEILSATLPLMDACHTDINRVCSDEENTLTCLVNNKDSLDKCCSAHIRSATGESAIDQTTFHNDVLLPAGSNLEFESTCKISKATLNRTSHYKNVQLAPGPVFFNETGDIDLTQPAGKLNWRGLDLAESQPPTRIFRNGTPEYVRLRKTSPFDQFLLNPMQLDISNSIEDIVWNTATIDDYYHFIYMSEYVRDTGTTKFHSTGRLARGMLAKPHIVQGIPVASGISTFSENGQFLSGSLSEDYTHRELTLAKGPVSFSEKGLVLTAKLAKPHRFDQFLLAADDVTFYKNGKLKSAYLQAGSVLNANPLPSKAHIILDEDGDLETLLFTKEDQLTPSSNTSTIEYGELTLSLNRAYQVHETGQIKETRFKTHKTYRDKLYPQYTELKFDQHGEVVWDSFYDVAMHDKHKKQQGMLPEVLPISQLRRGVFLPKGSIVYSGYYGKAERAITPKVARFNDSLLAPGEIKFSSHRNELQLAALHGDQIIDGVKFRGFPKSISFNEQGRVSYGYLSGDQVINEIWFADDSSINFHPDRTVLSGVLAKTAMIEGIPLQQGSDVQFYYNQRLKTGYLASEYASDGIVYKNGTRLYLDHEGHIRSGTLGRDYQVSDTIIPTDSTINRLHDGRLTLELKKNIEIQSYHLDGRSIELHENGTLRTGILARQADINNELISAGTQFLLDSSGQLIGKEHVGVIEPSSGSATNSRFAAISVPPPPSEATCGQLFNSSQSRGFASNPLKNKCRTFYSEYQE